MFSLRLLPVSALLVLFTGPGFAAEKPRPLMRDFMGLNTHTVQFKPELYAPVTRWVRDYHPLDWDTGKEPGNPTKFPKAQNGVDWGQLYGSWRKAGYGVNACIMFDNLDPKNWTDIPREAAAYGRAFATAFGPSAAQPVVQSIEIGNEPGKYDDATYRAIFEHMARGVREGDPKLRIATCAANLGKSGRYSKSVDLLAGLESLYDILNIHIYADLEPWPTFKKTYPEDPRTEFLTAVKHVLKWRADNAADKELWITEFGWDASTKPPKPTGDFAKWIGSNETQQAQWIVRGYLLFAALGVDRAYLYWFNDDDTPQMHGSSGLTRNYLPKPSFHAVAWLQRSLGEFRFSRVVREDATDCYAYEFVHGGDATKRVWAVWKPAGEETITHLPLENWTAVQSERMPLSADSPKQFPAIAKDGVLEAPAGGSPLFIWLEKR
ncbi:MAG: hypothetical protein JWQ44_1643 [Chthoniobacter sp.]|nr:hypothetical protein [Chthoniobacter sp.]